MAIKKFIAVSCWGLFFFGHASGGGAAWAGSLAEPADTLCIPKVVLLTGFDDARSVALRTDGLLIISEAGSDRIVSYQVNLNALGRKSGSGDCDLNTLQKQRDVRPDTLLQLVEQIFVPDLDKPDGLSLVMDTYTAVVSSGTGQVNLLDEHLEHMRTLAVPSWVLGDRIFRPTDVTGNEFGELFVLDSEEKRIYHFDANGAYLQHIELNTTIHPERFFYFGESLFIADKGSGKIHVITDNGRSLATIGTFPQLSRVTIIDGTIWVLSGDVIHLFSIAGEHLGNRMIQDSGDILRDVAGIDGRVFLLTSGSLYFWHTTYK